MAPLYTRSGFSRLSTYMKGLHISHQIRLFAKDRLALFCLVATLVFFTAALVGPYLSLQGSGDLALIELADSMLEPMSKSRLSNDVYILGTDVLGRDIFSMAVNGLRMSLVVAFVSTGTSLIFGCVAGMLAAYCGGFAEIATMRIVDIFLSIPSILIALLLISILGRGLSNTIIAICLVQWTHYARAINVSAKAELQKDYVKAAYLQGMPSHRVLISEVLPNCLGPVFVILTVQFGYVIALEASLSFLGLGLPITQPSLGSLVADGQEYLMGGKYWISLAPGFLLLALIFSINVVGDRLRQLQQNSSVAV